jgi:hypothetical protein
MSVRFVRGVRGRCLAVGAAAAIVIAAGCSEIPSDPQTPFAIEFNRAPSPSVVLGQTLFDSLGAIQPLKAVVYNSNGDVIDGAPVTYHVAPDDTLPITVDPGTGLVTAKSESLYAGRTARVYAQSGGLQSGTVVVTVTRSADTLVAADSLKRSFVLRFSDVDPLPLAPGATVKLIHKPALPRGAADSLVPAYLVRFRITKPSGAATDTSYVMLTNGDKKRSELDTTDANGVASRQIRIRRANFPLDNPASNDTISDTVVVSASAVKRVNGTVEPVPGSGIEFRLIIKVRAQ